MANNPSSTICVYKQFTVDATSQEMKHFDSINTKHAGGVGLDAGGFIKLDDATTGLVTVEDAAGQLVYQGTVTADTVVDATAHGLYGPLSVTLSAGDGGLFVYWFIKK